MTISYYRDGNGNSRACQNGRRGTRFALHVSTKPQTLQEGLCLKLRVAQRAGAYYFALQHGPFQRCGTSAKCGLRIGSETGGKRWMNTAAMLLI